MNERRITEAELILPSLHIMCNKPLGKVKTSELIPLLTELMKPQGIDIEILANRKDTYFSQKVRNLKSHNTLERRGLAKYNNGVYTITEQGRSFVLERKESIDYLFSSDFDYGDVRTALGKILKTKTMPYDETITEGNVKTSVSKRYLRSIKLRNAAIEHFSHNGSISCDCCGFEFKSFYGEKYGVSCIEIHHLRPIFQYPSSSITQTIDAALQNLMPVCPNCHRVIHRKHISVDVIQNFKSEIKNRAHL